MNPERNLPGAIIFWSYILAALVFASIPISLILRSKTPPSPQHRKNVWLFASLALFSFSALSFNMLHVLVQSYELWSKGQHALPLSLRTIWTWSTHSTLFEDFGNEIVASDARYIWTQSALWTTLAVCIYMGAEGNRLSLPYLWSFFVLSQILPISFAQNLFYLLLLRQPSTLSSKSRIGLRSWPTVFLFVAYCVCQFYARHASQTSRLIPTILITRVLLMVPMALATSERGLKPIAIIRFANTFGAGLVGFEVWKVLKAGTSVEEIGYALFQHPAVTALGFDAILSWISAALWVLMQQQEVVRSEKVQ